jgi:hypothetical protein
MSQFHKFAGMIGLQMKEIIKSKLIGLRSQLNNGRSVFWSKLIKNFGTDPKCSLKWATLNCLITPTCIKHKDTTHNDIQHKDTQYKGLICDSLSDTQHNNALPVCKVS